MPNFNGAGPDGAGTMTGRGLGPCGRAQAKGPANGRRHGYGYGHGCGRGIGSGSGRGMGHGFGTDRGRRWYSVGYGAGDKEAAATIGTRELEERRDFLRAELARTESLLGGNAPKSGEL
ncbi:MAG: DUF5320 domain-containing protein [Spirochaetaceae bacterium]|nr:DUF5320 domain-containing protein [Spirochaetaceae bacterium]